MKKLILIATALCLPAPAYAETSIQDDGNEILTYCDESATGITRGVCLGYIQGLWAGLDMMLAMNDRKMCIPKSVTLGQVRDVTVSYIRRNPATRHEGSMILFARALSEVWACK